MVKDLDIVYQDGIGTLKYDGTSSAAVPSTFFGGVIGCIMGGDNIIDDVKVGSGTSSEETSLQTLVSQGVAELVSLFSGKSQDLRIPVGGYVGAICGGGAIFRNTDTSWRKSTGGNGDLYNNPYVGRVIDGYAFSEGCTVDNGNDNYRINMLENRGTPCVETGDIFGKYRDGDNQEAITTTVKNAQGLLVLSAIIGSGAGAGACYTTHSDSEFGTMSGSKAYAGRTTEATGSYRFGNDSLGKVRNASYGYVGNVSAGGDVAVDDAKTANNDDTRAPGRQNSKAQGPLDNFADGEKEGADSVNSPYLVKNYATWQTGYVCAAKAAGMDLQFVANQEYDLRAYGTGFTGLSGRYYSNACYSNLGADRDRIVPLIACINGNGARLILESDVKQYLNDDFFLQSWGGLFSAVTFTKDHVATSISGNGDNVVQDLQFGSEDKEKHSTVSLMCVKDAAGTVATLDELKNSDLSKAAMENGIPHLGVGALAGATANRDSLASAGAFNAVSVRNCRVTGPSMVGGLLGNSGWAGRRTDTTKTRMLDFGSTCASPAKLTNCSYSNLTVTGATRVGGFVGAIGSGSDSGIWVTDPNAIVGQDSTISSTAKDCIVGGAFGLAWSKVQVNVPQSEDDSQSYSTAKMIGVTVQNNHAVASVSKDQPDDNKTYRGTGGIIGNTQRGCDVRNVRIAASDDSGESGSTDDYKVNIGRTASELKDGIVQCVGGIVGQANKYDQEVTYNFNGIKVENANMTADEGAGGLVGTVAAGTDISYANIVLSDVGFGKTYSGGLVGTIKNANAVVAATNIKVQNCTFEGDACSAIAGDGKGTFRLSNVLVSQNKYQAKDSQGLLLGKTWSAGSDKDLRGLYVAGLDVVPEGEKTTSDLPDYVAAAGTTTVAAIHQVSYVALADYTNASTKAGAAGHYGGDGSDLYSDEGGAIASASPYVTTNPVSTISINGKSLFSDGVATYRDNDNKDGFLAGKIKDEALATASASAGTGTYVYNNIGGCDKDGNYQNGEGAVSYKTTADSTFNENNPSIKQVTTDFPVLVISGNDTKTVASYLDVVTNGGFSDAVRLNNDKTEFVKATVKRIECDTKTRSLVESAESPSLTVVDNGKSSMYFRASSSWDNNEGRFTLLTVTFNDGAGHKYKVQVPVVVKRMLEINFSATYTYTTVFDKAKYGDAEHNAFNPTGGISADYAGYSDHVLVGSGEAMTGYLTWTYNQAGSTRTEYGWNTHLAAGGSMGPLGKTIVFDGSNGAGNMPVGTQLTLVDTAHNDKHYTYTVAGGKAHTVALKDFKCATGSYEESWMSELMHVGAKEDSTGAWVIMTDGQVKEHEAAGDLAECAGARIWSDLEKRFEYYWKAENDPEATKYKLTVPDENPQSESFYLIVRTPKNSDSVNGKTSTQISTSMVNTHINQVWRDKSCAADSGNNTPSTYGINSNYTQALFDNTSGGSQRMAETASPSPVGLDVTDTVSFSSSQQYADSDSLYFLFESSLVNYDGEDNTGSTGYPVGTAGTVKFYVSVGGTSYTWNGSEWVTAQNGEAAASVTLPDDGKDISIPLGTQSSDGTITPIDMRQLRNTAKTSAVDPNKIVVRITSDNMAMSYNACEMGIASTTPGADGSLAKWTQTSYRTYLATNPETLNVSSMMATSPGNMHYYRLGNDGRSTISLEASSKAQLGINVDDLDSANGEISLVSKYDFAGLHDGGAKLAKGNTVTYTFSLEQRQGGGSYAAVDDMSKYIVSIKSDKLGTAKLLNGKYVLEDVKQGNSFKTKTKTDSTSLGDRYTVKVNTAIEKNGLTYANYRIVLTAHLSGADVTDDPDNAQLLTGYNEKHSDYVTYTVTKIKTEGVDH